MVETWLCSLTVFLVMNEGQWLSLAVEIVYILGPYMKASDTTCHSEKQSLLQAFPNIPRQRHILVWKPLQDFVFHGALHKLKIYQRHLASTPVVLNLGCALKSSRELLNVQYQGHDPTQLCQSMEEGLHINTFQTSSDQWF